MRIHCEKGSSLNRKEKVLVEFLQSWWKSDRVERILLPFLTQQSTVSLRLLDWIVTNYSKSYHLVLHGNRRSIHIHEGYRDSMNVWGCKNFSPFRRGPKIWFRHGNTRYESTVGQLNFLSWCSSIGLLNYATSHKEDIREHMQSASVQLRKVKNKKRKRGPLSESPRRGCYVYIVPSEFIVAEFCSSDESS